MLLLFFYSAWFYLNFVPFICRAVAFVFLLLVIHNPFQRFCLQRKDQTYLHWGNTEFQSVFQCVFIVQLLSAVGNNSGRGTFIKAIRIILLLPFLSFLLSLEIIISHSTCLYTYTFTFFIGYIKPFSPMCMNPQKQHKKWKTWQVWRIYAYKNAAAWERERMLLSQYIPSIQWSWL